MAARIYYILPLFLFIINCRTHPKANTQIEHYTSKNDYKDFVAIDHQIWALTDSGKLKVFELLTGDTTLDVPRIDSPIMAIAKDRHSNIALAFGGKVTVFDKNAKTWSDFGKYQGRVYGMIFDASNMCFLITNNGIEQLSSQKFYFPDSSLNEQIRYGGQWFRTPGGYCVDNDNNIWIGFAYGEWGGDLFVFNTISHKFLIPQTGKFQLVLNPVRSIFPANSKVYLSAGLHHMNVSGSIVQFDHLSAASLFESEGGRRKDTVHGQYIGPAAFNSTDHCIYFYSQDGIFKGNPEKDLSTFDRWEKIVSPKLKWSYGQPDAAGYSMNVRKMDFAGDNLIFLTQSNGIGIYNEKGTLLVK